MNCFFLKIKTKARKIVFVIIPYSLDTQKQFNMPTFEALPNTILFSVNNSSEFGTKQYYCFLWRNQNLKTKNQAFFVLEFVFRKLIVAFITFILHKIFKTCPICYLVLPKWRDLMERGLKAFCENK